MRLGYLFAIVIAVAFMVPAVHSTTLPAAAPQRSILDGVYTEDQAIRGENLVYSAGCERCHGGGLAGGNEDTAALVGEDFYASWVGRTVGDLFHQVGDMPPDNSATINTRGHADLVAFLLWLNLYPSGDRELQPDRRILDKIEIVRPDLVTVH